MTSVLRRWHLFTITAVLGMSLPAMSQNLSEALLPMTGKTQSLLVVNNDSSPQSLWLSTPVNAVDGLQEQKLDIPAQSKLEIPLNQFQDQSFLRLNSGSLHLQLFWRDQPIEAWGELPWGVSNELFLKQGPQHLTIWVSNVTALPQTVELSGADSGAIYKTTVLKAYETQKIVYRGTASALRLISEGRVSAVVTDALLHQALSFFPLKSSFREQKGIPLFEVANQDRSESFVVAIEDATQLTQARAQIQNPQAFGPHLLIAEVAPGHGDVNQDLGSKYQSPWSWHVKQVFRFADFGSIDCDGSPSLVEKTLPWWSQAKGGLICFWGYRIVRELKP